MLRRKFYDILLNWKRTKKNECLLVKGARQIGKTFIINQFGKTEYSSYIYINFIESPDQKHIFEGSLEAKEIYKKISIYLPNINYVDNNTLIFIDEIQSCPRARTALKFLALDNKYDVIASGSLLGLHYNKLVEMEKEEEVSFSIPVGYEREIEMFSLDFEEFLWANGIGENAINQLKEYFTEKKFIEEYINNRYLNLLRTFLIVGGMPEVVNNYLSSNNFQKSYSTQQKILKAYEYDIDHYAKNIEKPKIKNCYYSIPRQLAKEYTKFQYKSIEKNGSSRKYANSIEWLIDAGLVKRVNNLSVPLMPLVAYEKEEDFKIYVSDIGLLTSMFGYPTQTALYNDTLSGAAKGGIYENLIFDILIKKGKKLNYYKNQNNSQEIEFLYENESGVIPIEVKSSRGQTISLNEFIKEYNPQIAYKLITGNIGQTGKKFTLPLYMAMFL